MRDADEGVMPVLEAILVAMIALAAILFVTNVQRPLAARQEAGVDLGDVAAQSLNLLAATSVRDSGGVVHTPAQWVNKTLNGDATVTTAVEKLLAQMLPKGAQYRLELTNGVGGVRLAPAADPGPPRNGRGADVPFMVNWTVYRASGSAAVDDVKGFPGQDVSVGHPVLADFGSAASSIQCVKAPNGSSTARGVTWRTRWLDASPKVPDEALYGVWAGYTNAGCTTGAVYARVALENGVVTDYPLYGLRLVVWYGG